LPRQVTRPLEHPSTPETVILRASLIPNVQFIYELALAQLELDAFGVEFTVTNSLREFLLRSPLDMDLLVRRLAYFKSIDGRITDYYRITRHNRTGSVNQYLTHWIYPYKGKFHPQMIRALLNILKLEENNIVLDNFIGSGTTAVEAQLLGINCVGFDISPLCVLQSRVKTESILALGRIKELQQQAIDSFTASKGKNALFAQYAPNAYQEFLDSISDERVRNFYIMAKLVSISEEQRRRREIVQSFVRNLSLMVASVEDYKAAVTELGLRLGGVDIRQADARALPLNDESVDGIITSPPYSIALDYVANDAHAFRALALDLQKMRDQFIGVRGKGDERISLYNQDMIQSFREMYRVLKRGKYCAIVVGNAVYQGQDVRTIEFTVQHCEKLGFRLLKNINKIIYGLYNVMQTDNTLIFQKMR